MLESFTNELISGILNCTLCCLELVPSNFCIDIEFPYFKNCRNVLKQSCNHGLNL